MAAATAVSRTRTRSRSNPTFRQSCRQSDAVDPIELTRRLELCRLEERVKKKYRRGSAGQYLTNQPLPKEHQLSFNIAESNSDLARSLEFHRRSLHTDSQPQRSKSAYASQSRPRSTAVEADELTRRLETHLNSSQGDSWTTDTHFRANPPAYPYVNTNRTRSRTNSQKRPKPSRPKSLPHRASHPKPPYHHTPTVAAHGLSCTATPDALDASKVHRLSHSVLHRYANPSTIYAAPEGGHYNPRTLAAARRRAQAYNDALAARNNFQNSAVMAEAVVHDRQRRQRGGGGWGKAPSRAERGALREQCSLEGISGNGSNGRHEPRPRGLPGAPVGRSNSGRGQRFDSPQEDDVPPIPCSARLPSDKNDWTQADETAAAAPWDPSRFSVVGLARKLSKRSVGSSTSGTRMGMGDGTEVVPPTPTIVVSEEAERWREKALVMREEAASRARALREERERGEPVVRTGGEGARRKPVGGVGSAGAAAAAATSPVSAAPPPAASPSAPPPPPPPVAMRPQSKRMASDWAVESGTEHMTLESRRLLEQQMKLLRRRTLEEKALREAVEQEKQKDGRSEVLIGTRGDGMVPALTTPPRQQERASRQRSETAKEKLARDELGDEKQRGAGKTLKAPDVESQGRRGCLGMLWRS